MKNIYIAKLVWNSSFNPENILVIAGSIEDAVELIHKRYKRGNETTFIRIDSLQKLEIPVTHVLTEKGEI